LAKALVELHHGCMRVNSKVGEGAQFTIDIPINKKTMIDADKSASKSKGWAFGLSKRRATEITSTL
jgi:hypothetical protein